MSLHIRHARGFWKLAIGETRYRKVLLLDGLCLEKMTLREIKKKTEKERSRDQKNKARKRDQVIHNSHVSRNNCCGHWSNIVERKSPKKPKEQLT